VPGLKIASAFALLLTFAAAGPASAQPTRADGVLVQQRRPRIVIHPRTLEPGPNAKRYCRAWLAQEYRPSGTVIVPRRECWWQ